MSTTHPTDTPDGYPENYVDPADKLMLAALRAGTYILAVRCRSCGAPLTNRESKALGIGPDCRRKAVAIGDSSDMAGGSPTPTFSSAPTKRSANEGAA